MKKRLIALLLCLVMLVTCMGVGVDVLTGDEDAAAPETTVEPSAEPSSTPEQDESDLFAQLMACETQEEMDALLDGVTEKEIAALLTEEQISAASEHYAALAPASEETADESALPAPSFTKAGPIIGHENYGVNNSVIPSRKALRAKANATNNTPAQKEENGVILSKSSKLVSGSSSEKAVYEIDLAAEAKSVIVNNAKACDIVLVLDRSGSMKGDNVKSLITSVNSFLATVQKSSPDSRVAIVTYADKDTTGGAASIDSGGKTADTAFVPVTSTNAAGGKIVNPALTDLVNGLENRCDGGTQSSKGLEKAVDIFHAVPAQVNGKANEVYDNSRVTVMFTDGIPGNSTWEGNDYLIWLDNRDVCGYRVAQESIHWGTILKAEKGSSVSLDMNSAFYKDYSKPSASTFAGKTTGCGATVYAVGLNLPEAKKAEDDGAKINEYMYRVSSHRKTGTHVTTSTYENPWEHEQEDWVGKYYDNLTRNRPEGSYYPVGKNDELNKIFTTIASQTGASVKNVSVRDYISPYFDICDSNGNKLSVGDKIVSGDMTGIVKQDANGMYIEWSNITLTPPEVDSNGNITTAATKFESKIYVTPKDEFLGGNGVPTNGNSSGIYDGDHTLAKFPEPTVDVATKANVSAVDYNVYLRGSVPSIAEMYKLNNVENPLTWQDDFVTVTETLDKSVSNTADGTYTVTVKVTPKNEGTATEVTKTATAKVNVFTPVLTYQDSAIDLGTTPKYDTENYVSTAWKHDGTDSTAVTMVGEAPELELSYDPGAKAFSEDTHVKVTVKIGGTDVTGKVEFVHKECTYEPCHFDDKQGQFIVHIKTFDLTITKSITSKESDLYGARDFVFNVQSADGTTNIDVVVHVDANSSTGSTTVKGLPVGTYTITENHAWSWRYKLEGVVSNGTGTVNADTANYSATYIPSGTNNNITFTNSWLHAQWLSFTTSVQNIFGNK